MPVPNQRHRQLVAIAAGSVLGLAILCAGPAQASGDFGCPASLALNPSGIDPQCWNAPFLNPRNDTRINLQLLLTEAGLIGAPRPPVARANEPWRQNLTRWETPLSLDDFSAAFGADGGAGSDAFANGEGSRCLSNRSGAADFEAAVAASALPDAEKSALMALRKRAGAACDDESGAGPPMELNDIRSPEAREFGAYLLGADSFYAGDFNVAQKQFASLRDSRNPWLREATRYMLARVALNAAQKDAFGEWGELDRGRVDAVSLDQAEQLFEAYLKAYPKGTYAASARGLLRRTAWLGGRTDRLVAQFAWQFDHPRSDGRNVSAGALAQEADAKLLSGEDLSAVKEPRLLATIDLKRMRLFKDDKGQIKDPAPITRAALEGQRPAFAGYEALFNYLVAAHAFYVENDPAEALKQLPDAPPSSRMGPLAFSEQILRGLALEGAGNAAEARRQFLRLIPVAEPLMQRPAVELAVTRNYERAGDLTAAFAPASPVLSETYRQQLLTFSASADLLRNQASAGQAPERERRTAQSVLLYKELTRGRYRDFLADLKRLPPDAAFESASYDDPMPAGVFLWPGVQADHGYACPSIKGVARALAKDARDPAALICLNEFVRRNGMDEATTDRPPTADELGGGPSQFPGGVFSRLEVYKQILANPKASADVRAYALYRAVNCYAPSGYNACGGTDVPLSQRKQWFQELKAKFAGSRWAVALKYYW